MHIKHLSILIIFLANGLPTLLGAPIDAVKPSRAPAIQVPNQLTAASLAPEFSQLQLNTPPRYGSDPSTSRPSSRPQLAPVPRWTLQPLQSAARRYGSGPGETSNCSRHSSSRAPLAPVPLLKLKGPRWQYEKGPSPPKLEPVPKRWSRRFTANSVIHLTRNCKATTLTLGDPLSNDQDGHNVFVIKHYESPDITGEASGLVAKLLFEVSEGVPLYSEEIANLQGVGMLKYSGLDGRGETWVVMARLPGVPLKSTDAWQKAEPGPQREALEAHASTLVGKARVEGAMNHGYIQNYAPGRLEGHLFEENNGGIIHTAHLPNWQEAEKVTKPLTSEEQHDIANLEHIPTSW